MKKHSVIPDIDIKPLIKYGLLLCLGALLIWLTYRKQDLTKLGNVMLNVQWLWYFLVLIWTLICHVLRTLRWQLLLESADENVGFWPAYHSMMSGYFVNFLTGKLGEIARCFSLKYIEETHVQKSLGTVVTERVVDIFCLLSIILITLLIYFREISMFLTKEVLTPLINFSVGHRAASFSLALLIPLLIIVLVHLAFRSYRNNLLSGFRQGLLSVFHLKRPGLFFLYTVLIWVMYHLMTYTWFFAFDGAKSMGPGVALMVISLGGIGRSLPIPGHGIGAYHYFAGQALLMSSAEPALAVSIPLVIHAGQTLFYLLTGSVSLIWVLILHKKKNPAK